MALDSNQQAQLSQALQTKGGYKEIDATNAAANAGGRAMELYKEFVGNSMSGSSGGGGGVDQATENLRRAISLNTDAIRGQQDLLPQQTQQRQTQLQQQQSSLEQRYQSLIGEIKEQTASAVNRTTGTTKEELARRGINLEGNLAGQQINAAVNPLNIEGGRQLTNVGIARESDINTITNALNQLPLQERQQWLALQQALAQAQMSGSESELNIAMKLLAQQQQQEEANRAYQLKLQEMERNAPLLSAQIANIESQIAERNRVAATGSNNNLEQSALNNILNKNNISGSSGGGSFIPDNVNYDKYTSPTQHPDFYSFGDYNKDNPNIIFK